MMRNTRIALAIATMVWSLPLYGQPASLQGEWINALREGGHVIVIRHDATPTDQADTDPFHLRNINNQRHLNDMGRAQARSIGEALHKLKILVSEVDTSMLIAPLRPANR